MPELFSPLTLGSLTIPNRAWVAPMCQYMAVDGVPNDWHHVHYAGYANGGFGLVLTEATAVSPEGRITPDDTGLWNDAHQDAWAHIVRSVHARGARIGVQLGHAGRKASTWSPFDGRRGSVSPDDGGWATTAPSALAFGDYAAPSALPTSELSAVCDQFVAAALRAVAAGFDVVEIHAAHGYLLHQFLSPLSNQRTDAYGGGLAQRARLLLEVSAAVRAAIPNTPLFVRVSATDWEPGGLSVPEVGEVSAWLREIGVDLIDVSTGGNIPHPQIPVGPGYQVPAARAIRTAAGLPVSAVGLITSPEYAAALVEGGDVDAVMIGRAALADPHWALHAADALGAADVLPQTPHRTRHFAGTASELHLRAPALFMAATRG